MKWLLLLLLIPALPGIVSLGFVWFTWRVPLAHLRFILFSYLSFVTDIAAVILSPILAAWSVIAGRDVLPRPFDLFHTDDDTLDGGQHQLGWPEVSGFALWKQRMAWICRNPAYGFDSRVWGFVTPSAREVYAIRRGTGLWTARDGTNMAFMVLETLDGRRFWSIRINWVYSQTRYLKLWLGWNYVQYAAGTYKIKNTVNPVKNF